MAAYSERKHAHADSVENGQRCGGDRRIQVWCMYMAAGYRLHQLTTLRIEGINRNSIQRNPRALINLPMADDIHSQGQEPSIVQLESYTVCT